MACSQDLDLRDRAAELLGKKFYTLEDKETAWQDLLWLAEDDDGDVRFSAARSIGFAFHDIPDKQWAWQILIELTYDRNGDVRSIAAESLGIAFQYMFNKMQAWQDLIKLALYADTFVQWSAIKSLNSNFRYMTDKKQAWQDYLQLAEANNSYVRGCAYLTLGRTAIFRATEAEEMSKMKAKLEEAIGFFNKASEEKIEGCSYHFADFCLPFYRALYSLLFSNVIKDTELQKYLCEAEKGIKSSNSKKMLLDCVGHLYQALQEVKQYTIGDIISCQRDLRAYTRYCIKVEESLNTVRKQAPFACIMVDAVILEKSIPILDSRIKSLLHDVEETTSKLCDNSKRTKLEEFGRSVYENTKGLGQVKSPIEVERYFEEITPLLRLHCDRLPKISRIFAKNLIDSMETASFEGRLKIVKDILQAALIQGENDDLRIEEYKELVSLLKIIENGVSRLSFSLGATRQNLFELQVSLRDIDNKIRTQCKGMNELNITLEEIGKDEKEKLAVMKNDLLQAVQNLAKDKSNKEDAEKILKEVQRLKLSKARDLLGVTADLLSIVGLAISIWPK